MVKIKSGDDDVFEFLLLNGGNLIDTSQIQALTLEVLDIGCLNALEPRSVKLLASKTLSADNTSHFRNNLSGKDLRQADGTWRKS